MDINEEVKNATEKVVREQLPKMVEQKVQKMIDDILSDVFRSYSEVGKQVKEKIEKGLNINLQDYDMVDYNVLVSKAINNRLIGLVNEEAIKPIMELVEDTVGFVKKKEIKLSNIHEMVIEASMEDNEDKGEGEISFHVIENQEHKWTTVAFDLDADVDEKDCSCEFLISGERKTMFSLKTKSYWSRKGELTPAKVTQLSNLEHKIFRLYSAQVKIEIDDTDFSNTWSRYN